MSSSPSYQPPNKTNATQNKFTEIYWKCVDIFIFSTKHSTQLTQRSSHNNIQNDLTQSWIYLSPSYQTLLSSIVFFSVVGGLLYSIGREAERAHRLYQYFERVWEIRHTWKLKTTQNVSPRSRIKDISWHFQNISNFRSLATRQSSACTRIAETDCIKISRGCEKKTSQSKFCRAWLPQNIEIYKYRWVALKLNISELFPRNFPDICRIYPDLQSAVFQRTQTHCQHQRNMFGADIFTINQFGVLIKIVHENLKNHNSPVQ